jgi:hypothetical protein
MRFDVNCPHCDISLLGYVDSICEGEFRCPTCKELTGYEFNQQLIRRRFQINMLSVLMALQDDCGVDVDDADLEKILDSDGFSSLTLATKVAQCNVGRDIADFGLFQMSVEKVLLKKVGGLSIDRQTPYFVKQDA